MKKHGTCSVPAVGPAVGQHVAMRAVLERFTRIQHAGHQQHCACENIFSVTATDHYTGWIKKTGATDS